MCDGIHFVLSWKYLPQIYRWANQSLRLRRKICGSKGCHIKALLRALCLRKALHFVYRMSRHAAITAHEKERLCDALSLLVS